MLKGRIAMRLYFKNRQVMQKRHLPICLLARLIGDHTEQA